jgi:hypothetical protein
LLIVIGLVVPLVIRVLDTNRRAALQATRPGGSRGRYAVQPFADAS